MRTRPVTVLVTALLLGCSDDGGGGADATQSTSPMSVTEPVRFTGRLRLTGRAR